MASVLHLLVPAVLVLITLCVAKPRPDIQEAIGSAVAVGMSAGMSVMDVLQQGAAIRGGSETELGDFKDKRNGEMGFGQAVQHDDSERRKRSPCTDGNCPTSPATPTVVPGARRKRSPCGRGGRGGGGGGDGSSGGGAGDTPTDDDSDVESIGSERLQRRRPRPSKAAAVAATPTGARRRRRDLADDEGSEEGAGSFSDGLSSALKRFVDAAHRVAARVREVFQSAGAGGAGGGEMMPSDVERMDDM